MMVVILPWIAISRRAASWKRTNLSFLRLGVFAFSAAALALDFEAIAMCEPPTFLSMVPFMFAGGKGPGHPSFERAKLARKSECFVCCDHVADSAA